MLFSRLNHIFRGDGRSFILAMDHGSNFNVLPALKNPKKLIKEVAEAGADAFLATVGMAENFGAQFCGKGIILRVDGGVSQLGRGEKPEKPMQIVADTKDALRLGCDAMITMAFPGASVENETLSNMTRLCLDAHKWGMPVVAEALPFGFEKPEEWTAENITFACRQSAELGADIIKTNYTGDKASFKKLVESVYVPVVILGGAKKMTEKDLLAEIREALDAGAAGVAMGRNIWGSKNPAAFTRSIARLIHEDCSVEDALKELNQ